MGYNKGRVKLEHCRPSRYLRAQHVEEIRVGTLSGYPGSICIKPENAHFLKVAQKRSSFQFLKIILYPLMIIWKKIKSHLNDYLIFLNNVFTASPCNVANAIRCYNFTRQKRTFVSCTPHKEFFIPSFPSLKALVGTSPLMATNWWCNPATSWRTWLLILHSEHW